MRHAMPRAVEIARIVPVLGTHASCSLRLRQGPFQVIVLQDNLEGRVGQPTFRPTIQNFWHFERDLGRPTIAAGPSGAVRNANGNTLFPAINENGSCSTTLGCRRRLNVAVKRSSPGLRKLDNIRRTPPTQSVSQ